MGANRCGWVLALLAVASCREQTSSLAVEAPSVVPPGGKSATPLPPIAREWQRPTMKFESGPCWARVFRLDDATLSATERAFEARNPGWKARANPFTGLVEQADRTWSNGRVGEAPQLSEDEYHRRGLASLRLNADLVGIRASDFDAFQWEPLRGPDHGSARILCSDPGLRAIPDAAYCWNIGIYFDRDNVVNGFHTVQLGPPVEMCTRPSLSAEQARAVPWLRAKSPPPNLGFSDPGYVGPPRQLGEARLVVDRDSRNIAGRRSLAWRLAWAIDANDHAWALHVDAATGDPVGIQRLLID